MLRRSLIIIGGPSGSGKTTLANNLCNDFPDEFVKLTQVTTRSMREGETENDPYKFIDNDTYNSMKSSLIFTTEREHGKYGTILDTTNEDTAKIVIADTNALEELIDSKSSTHIQCREAFDSVLVIGVDYSRDLESNKYRMTGRENRNNEFYEEFLKYTKLILRNDSNQWISSRQLKRIIIHELYFCGGYYLFENKIQELRSSFAHIVLDYENNQ